MNGNLSLPTPLLIDDERELLRAETDPGRHPDVFAGYSKRDLWHAIMPGRAAGRSSCAAATGSASSPRSANCLRAASRHGPDQQCDTRNHGRTPAG